MMIQYGYLKQDLFANLIMYPFVSSIDIVSLYWLDIEEQIKSKRDLLQNRHHSYCLKLTPFPSHQVKDHIFF